MFEWEIQLRIDAARAEDRRKLIGWLASYSGDLRQRITVLDLLFNPRLDQSQSDVAADMGVSPGYVSQQLKAIRQQLEEIDLELFY